MENILPLHLKSKIGPVTCTISSNECGESRFCAECFQVIYQFPEKKIDSMIQV